MTPQTPINPLPPRGAKTVKAPAARKPKRLKSFLLIVLLAIVIGGIAFGAYTFLNLDDAINKITEEAPDNDVPEEHLAKKKPITVLLLGLDNRPVTGSMNTDVIMVVSLNPDDQSASVVSLPRDTYVKVENWKAHKAN